MVDEWLALARRDQGRLAETKRGRSLGPLGSFVLVTAACCGVLWGAADAAACTIGCATGAATFDGRPILTQSYDYSYAPYDYLMVLSTPDPGYDFLRVSRRDSSGNLGWQTPLNEAGLAYGLNIAPALGSWTTSFGLNKLFRERSTIAGVRAHLANQATYEPNHNFVFVGADAKASAMEIGYDVYWEYDVENPTRHAQSDFLYGGKNLFAVRADISLKNDHHTETQAAIDDYTAQFANPVRFKNARRLYDEYINNGDPLTLSETYRIARFGDPWTGQGPSGPISAARGAQASWSTQYAVTVLGVGPGEDGRFAAMLVAMGQPDYSIFVPCWVALKQLSPYLADDGPSYENIRKYANKLLKERLTAASDKTSYDEYINSLFRPLEENLAQAVLAARTKWFAGHASPSRFSIEIDHLHRWGANAAFNTIKSAYLTANQGSGQRNCNRPPAVDFSTSITGLTVTIDDAGTADANGIRRHWINWGDTLTDHAFSGDVARRSHTYGAPGTYLVGVLVEDNNATHGARSLKFKWVTVLGGPSADAGPSLDAGANDGEPSDGGGGSDAGSVADAGALDSGISADGSASDSAPGDTSLGNDAARATDARATADAARLPAQRGAGHGIAAADDPMVLQGGCAYAPTDSADLSGLALLALSAFGLLLHRRRARHHETGRAKWGDSERV